MNARSEELESVETGYRSEVSLDDDDDNDDDGYLIDNMLIGKHIWSGRVLPISKHARPYRKILPQCPDPIEILDPISNSNSIWSGP